MKKGSHRNSSGALARNLYSGGSRGGNTWRIAARSSDVNGADSGPVARVAVEAERRRSVRSCQAPGRPPGPAALPGTVRHARPRRESTGPQTARFETPTGPRARLSDWTCARLGVARARGVLGAVGSWRGAERVRPLRCRRAGRASSWLLCAHRTPKGLFPGFDYPGEAKNPEKCARLSVTGDKFQAQPRLEPPQGERREPETAVLLFWVHASANWAGRARNRDRDRDRDCDRDHDRDHDRCQLQAAYRRAAFVREPYGVSDSPSSRPRSGVASGTSPRVPERESATGRPPA